MTFEEWKPVWKESLARAEILSERYPASGFSLGGPQSEEAILKSFATLLAICPHEVSAESLFDALPDVAHRFVLLASGIDSRLELFHLVEFPDAPDRPYYLMAMIVLSMFRPTDPPEGA